MEKGPFLQFTKTEIFTCALAIISIIINIIQYQKARLITKPIYNGMLGLFNDIKSKILTCYQKQNILFLANNPHKDIETLRWNFNEFAQQVIGYLEGFKKAKKRYLKLLNLG